MLQNCKNLGKNIKNLLFYGQKCRGRIIQQQPVCMIRRSSKSFFFILILETPPSLVNLKMVTDINEWMENKKNIYIGRACRSYTSASYWQNPFSISSTCSREQAISRYEEFVKQDEEMLESLPSLGGMTMGCWCVPLPCHGQILIKYFMNYVKIVQRQQFPPPTSRHQK